MRDTTRPDPLIGLTVRLDRHVEPAVRTKGEHGRYLLLISSDECRFSLEEVDGWRQLLAKVPFGPDDAVLHLSVSGSGIANALAEVDQAPYQFLQFSDRAAFVAETGLSWTPAVALLDSHFRLRFISSHVTPDVATHIVNSFGNVDGLKGQEVR